MSFLTFPRLLRFVQVVVFLTHLRSSLINVIAIEKFVGPPADAGPLKGL